MSVWQTAKSTKHLSREYFPLYGSSPCRFLPLSLSLSLSLSISLSHTHCHVHTGRHIIHEFLYVQWQPKEMERLFVIKWPMKFCLKIIVMDKYFLK